MPQPGDINLNTVEGQAMFQRVMRGDLSDFAPKPVKVPKKQGPSAEQLTLFQLLCHEAPQYNWTMELKPFAPARDYRFDIAAPWHDFAVEVDGKPHGITKQMIADRKKDRYARLNGWYVTRVHNHEVQLNLDAILRDVLAELERWERRTWAL